MEPIVGMKSIFEKACTCLQDKRVGVMGLHGTGGVGKTTLLKKIKNEFLDVNANHEFNVVIWVVVSKQLDFGRVQEAIRVKLSIQDEQWNNKSEDLRAAEIHNVLKTIKFVVMLDDLWEPIELSKIGVPCPDESNMCKVMFTTRSEEVCHSMNAQELIRLYCLPPNEAFNLLCSKVGEDIIKSHRDILNLAKAIAAECQGLPLALVTIGGAMAGRRNPQEWRHAITTLKNSPAGMEDNVLRILLYSYNRLESETHRNCLVYCSLFPEDYDICEEGLIELWLGEGFLGEYNSNVGEARAQGEYVINSLKRACFLEEGDEMKSVRMHDVIRDMALWVSDDKYEVQVGDKWNAIGRWNNAQRIALWNYSGNHLVEVPNFPNLITLFIQSTKLEELPPEFFDSMEVLRVLDLSNNKRLKKLPNGIGGLTNLEYLDVSNTNINELPIEVQHLKNLKILSVSCDKIQRKVMESLSSLQVFHRHFNYLRSETDEMSECESMSSEREMLEGLMCLENLKDLCVYIHHASNVIVLGESPKLQGCIRNLFLYRVKDLASFSISRRCEELETVAIYECKELEEVKIEVSKEEDAIIYLPSYAFSYSVKLRHLLVKGCPLIRNLTALIYAHNLETLVLMNCESMEEIVSEKEESQVQNVDIFSSLTSLRLEYLPRLRSICPHNLLFPSLGKIEVFECPNLTKLPFDSDTANNTPWQKIQIEGEECWWDTLVWKNEATKQLFASGFKRISS